MPYQWKEHNGKKYLHIDYRLLTKKQILSQIYEVGEIIKNSPVDFPSLIDLENVPMTEYIFESTKEFTAEVFSSNKGNCSVLGNTGIKKFLLEKYKPYMPDNIQVFDTKEEALEFLVEEIKQVVQG